MNRYSHTMPIAIIASVLIGSGCTVVPDVAEKTYWYEPNTDMATKAKVWEEASMGQLNTQGLLLYSSYDPKGWVKKEDPAHMKGWMDYVESHNIADAPAWQGRLMASLSLAMACDGRDRNKGLLLLANGLKHYYSVTGVKGLLGRSYLSDYIGPRMGWMKTEEQDPDKFWKQGEGSRWWRTGLAKNHFLGAVLGCGIPLSLHEKGLISLDDETRQTMLDVMMPAVETFVKNDYRIIDYNGKMTEFGDLRPVLVPKEYIDALAPFVSIFGISEEDLQSINKPLNAFNMLLVLSILRNAGQYDTDLMSRYNAEEKAWGPWIAKSFKVLGFAIKKIGHAKLDKPSYSDMEAIAFAMLGLMIWEKDAPIADHVREGMKGLWGYMRFERNPAFSIPYKIFVDQTVDLSDVLEDLKDFPMPSQKICTMSGRKDTKDIHPLANRRTNTHYWKSSPFKTAIGPYSPAIHPGRGSKQYYSGQDYLIAYYLWRYMEKLGIK